jgi:stage V sporulation protein G
MPPFFTLVGLTSSKRNGRLSNKPNESDAHGRAHGKARSPEDWMEITEVRIHPVEDVQRLKAYVAITLDHCFVVRDLKIIDGDEGLFVAMPSRRRPDGSYRDIAHPLNAETRAMVEERVLSTWAQMAPLKA